MKNIYAILIILLSAFLFIIPNFPQNQVLAQCVQQRQANCSGSDLYCWCRGCTIDQSGCTFKHYSNDVWQCEGGIYCSTNVTEYVPPGGSCSTVTQCPAPTATPTPTPIPTPICPTSIAAPTNLSPNGTTFSSTTTSVNLSWGVVSDANRYALRLRDNTINPTGTCGSSGVTCWDNVTATSYTVSVTAGHSYTWWVHAIKNASGSCAEVWSSQATANFSISPSFTPTPTSAPISTPTPTPTSSCSGNVALTLNPSTVAPSGTVTPQASGLTNCSGKIISFKSCSSGGGPCLTTVSSCTSSPTGCSGNAFTAPSTGGSYLYSAWIDKNGDGSINSATGEAGSATLTVTATATPTQTPTPIPSSGLYKLIGRAFIDNNQNKIKDIGEICYSGTITVSISGPTPKTPVTYTQDSGCNNSYTFSGLAAGTHTVTIQPISYFSSTSEPAWTNYVIFP